MEFDVKVGSNSGLKTMMWQHLLIQSLLQTPTLVISLQRNISRPIEYFKDKSVFLVYVNTVNKFGCCSLLEAL